jgi:ABC-type multidrug transport system fused ATPase/permease subunit
MVVIGVLRLLERVLLTVGALSFSAERLGVVLGATLALAVLASIRATIRAPLMARLRARFVTIVARALLHRRALAPTTTQAESSVVLFDGLWVAEELLVDRIPAIVADGLAAIVLAAIALAKLPVRDVLVGSLALLASGLVLEGARRVAGKHAQRSYDAFLPVAADIDGCAQGGLELLANGQAHDHEKRVVERAVRWARIGWRADWLAGLSGRMPVLIGFLGLMIGAVYLEVGRGASLEVALASALVLASFLPPFASLLTNLVELTQVRPRLAPVADLLSESSAPASPSEPIEPLPPKPIRWVGIDYAYRTPHGQRAADVLSNLTGEWRPQRILGITGPNGAGKTTLFRLLLGLDRPTRGSIRFGDLPFDELVPEVWRRSVAYLPQRPFFPTDIAVREGIRFLAPDASDHDMEQALRRVGVWARLERAPDARPLQVPLSELSAGERQRVALARVLLQRAPFLLLDEPDANLDKGGADLLVEVLRAERARCMIAFIAHDDHVLVAADDVLRLPPSRSAKHASLDRTEGRRRVEQPRELEKDL